MIHAPRNEATRERLRREASASTFVMATVMGFNDITEALHAPMCNWIDLARPEPGFNRMLGIITRDHLKTSLWTIANSVRRVTIDPYMRLLLANETATNSQHFLRVIKGVFERNELYKWLFPERIPAFGRRDFKWSDEEICLPRDTDFPESTIETIGVGGAVVSRHYKMIKCDDLIGKSAEGSAKVMKDSIDWYHYLEPLLVAPTDEMHVFGTPWGFNDLLANIRKNEGEYYNTYITGCYHKTGPKTGEPIWPERFPKNELERILKKIGPYKFSCQYLCDPSDPDATNFDPTWLRFWRWSGDAIETERGELLRQEDFNFFIRIDPAISEKEDSARSAIIVDGVYKDGRKFVFEAWAKRCHPFEMIEKAMEFVVQYDPMSLGVEGVAYQRILKPIFEGICATRQIYVNVVTFNPDTRERKANRILGLLQPYAFRGELWLRKDHDELLSEYTLFPNGPTMDLMDAWAYGAHQWIEPNEVEGSEEEVERLEYEQNLIFEDRDGITGY